MTDWLIEPFRSTHIRANFSCGEPSLDGFIQRLVSQYEQRGLGKTYVAVAPGSSSVLGYYTLVAGSIPFDSVPPDLGRRLPRHPVPVVLIGRLAVAQESQGHQLGAALLRDSLRRALGLSADLGIHAVLVDALNDRAASFYRKYGFVGLADKPHRLLLPISSLSSARNPLPSGPALKR